VQYIHKANKTNATEERTKIVNRIRLTEVAVMYANQAKVNENRIQLFPDLSQKLNI